MALNVDANNRQLHPSEARRIRELARERAEAECRGNTDCIKSNTLHWTDMMQRVVETRVDDEKAAINEAYNQQVINAAGITNTQASVAGRSVQFFEDMITARQMLNADIGSPIVGSNGQPLLDNNGQPLTMFSATVEQRANPTLGTFLGQMPGDVIPNKGLRDQDRLDNLRAINGSATPIYPVEEVLLGGAVGNRVAGTLGRAVSRGDQVVTAEQAAANRLTDQVTEETFALERIGRNPSGADLTDKTPNSVLLQQAERISTAKSPVQVTAPRDLNEQVLWNQVIDNPSAGQRLSSLAGDTRFPQTEGFVKMQATHKLPDGTSITIHYQYNSTTGKAYDVKIVTPQPGSLQPGATITPKP
jgi:hypothetical protein